MNKMIWQASVRTEGGDGFLKESHPTWKRCWGRIITSLVSDSLTGELYRDAHPRTRAPGRLWDGRQLVSMLQVQLGSTAVHGALHEEQSRDQSCGPEAASSSLHAPLSLHGAALRCAEQQELGFHLLPALALRLVLQRC